MKDSALQSLTLWESLLNLTGENLSSEEKVGSEEWRRYLNRGIVQGLLGAKGSFCVSYLEFSGSWASQVVLVIKHPSANAGDIKDVGSVWGQEDPPEKGRATHSRTLAWNTMDRGAWWSRVLRVSKSQTRL